MGNFSDVFKAVFATTKTTATHLPVVTSAGAPDGIISTSDLASVLGVRKSILTNDDLNTYIEEGRFKCSTDSIASSLSNCPISAGFIMNVYHGANSVIQQVIPFSGSAVYLRRYKVSTSSFATWYKYTGEVVS